jgi:ABC-type siderophore export system fused ATPase/permease subunit
MRKDENPAPGTQKTYTMPISTANSTMIPILSSASYFNFISGTMITLFVVALVIIFVYEYEVLRRPKNQS